MSGEGTSCANLDYAAWGYASGTYPVNCIDCGHQPEEDKILGSISSMRCLFHAIEARSRHLRHQGGSTMSFYEASPINFDGVLKDNPFMVIGSTVMALLTIFGVVFYSGLQH